MYIRSTDLYSADEWVIPSIHSAKDKQPESDKNALIPSSFFFCHQSYLLLSLPSSDRKVVMEIY